MLSNHGNKPCGILHINSLSWLNGSWIVSRQSPITARDRFSVHNLSQCNCVKHRNAIASPNWFSSGDVSSLQRSVIECTNLSQCNCVKCRNAIASKIGFQPVTFHLHIGPLLSAQICRNAIASNDAMQLRQLSQCNCVKLHNGIATRWGRGESLKSYLRHG